MGEVKRTVADILSQFGKGLMFHEYTAHNISHVNDMLTTVDWLVPSLTQEILSKAEWLMIVLSIYFHDMGLVVTEDEFQKRSSSGFKAFCDDRLFSLPGGADYKDKVDALPPDHKERFLYQEFVRANHGRRVRSWVEGRANLELGYAASQMNEIGRLLTPLDLDFRRDLGLVCESHNLDDIDNVAKYRVSHPYGNSDDETVNLQYCAVLLRTIDLLQITRGRTPSVLYRLINPSDPISQAEWAKQAAVKRVRAKTAVDREGNASSTLPSDTVEIFATFDDDSAFFGLTSYLRYAGEQISASYAVIQKSRRLIPKQYGFPWRYVDDANVEVEGFVKKPFGFEIDQDKIFDLLTGHTLYNDSNVVVRELVQNSIDAVRLQARIDGADSEIVGKVQVSWSSEKSELTVVDNGTGMTQEIIESHLLKVGSSRYQDPKFREQYPAFSPISRFGIGVLSSFMVADSVEIVTVSPDEEYARQISLRSVHGKYLIRLLEKNSDAAALAIGPHGTALKLRFRQSARRLNVLDTVQTWIMFPRCQISVIVDGGTPTSVGYKSPKIALESYLARSTVTRWMGGAKLKVEERSFGGLTLAYALRYSSHFRDWSFVGLPQRNLRSHLIDSYEERAVTATCIEGIAVEFETPGFRGGEILAIANATGLSAPKTNVARSSIEATDEKEDLARTVYKILFDAVGEESKRLRSEEAYSLTWSIEQMPFIIAPALGQRTQVQYPVAHQMELNKVPMFLVETDDIRVERSLSDLEDLSSFWTVDSALTRSVENFIREAKSEVTASRLMVVSQGTSSALPPGPVLANNHSSEIVRGAISTKFQAINMVGNVAERRLDIQWGLSSDIWVSREQIRMNVMQSGNREMYAVYQMISERSGRQNSTNVFLPLKNISTSGISEYFAISAYSTIYLLPDTKISTLFKFSDKFADFTLEDCMDSLILVEAVSSGLESQSFLLPAFIDRFFKQLEGSVPSKWLEGRDRLITAVVESPELRVFNPLSWGQRGSND